MDDEDEYERPMRKLRWQNVLAVVLSGTSGVLEATADLLEGTANLMMQAGNYEDSRQEFHEEAAIELEMLLEDGDG